LEEQKGERECHSEASKMPATWPVSLDSPIPVTQVSKFKQDLQKKKEGLNFYYL
jgi:hypothetical protein